MDISNPLNPASPIWVGRGQMEEDYNTCQHVEDTHSQECKKFDLIIPPILLVFFALAFIHYIISRRINNG